MENNIPNNKELGTIGFKVSQSFSGNSNIKIADDPLALLRGEYKHKYYTEMVLNDPYIGANYKMTTILGSRGKWNVKSGSNSNKDKKIRDFIYNALFEDMDMSLNEIVKFVLGSLYTYGFSILEVVYKKRPDGRIGLKKLGKRYSPTIKEWKINNNEVLGVIQEDPNNFNKVFIPYNRLLHFKIESVDGSPEGISLTRNCFTSYYLKKETQIDEAIRVRKDARGISVYEIPLGFFDESNESNKAMLSFVRKSLANIANGKDSYLFVPSNPGFKYSQTPVNGSITQDTNVIIERSNRDIVISQLSDFLLMGSKSGNSSGNLATTKVKIYTNFVSSLMDIFKDIVNKKLIPDLLEKNNIKTDNPPKLIHDNLNELETMEIALLMQSGSIKMNKERDQYIAELFCGENMPELSDEEFSSLDSKTSKAVNNNQDIGNQNSGNQSSNG